MVSRLDVDRGVCDVTGQFHYRAMSVVLTPALLRIFRTTCEGCGKTIKVQGAKWVAEQFVIEEDPDIDFPVRRAD
jgi:hypothetical protein